MYLSREAERCSVWKYLRASNFYLAIIWIDQSEENGSKIKVRSIFVVTSCGGRADTTEHGIVKYHYGTLLSDILNGSS